jgi:hypothetical protein
VSNCHDGSISRRQQVTCTCGSKCKAILKQQVSRAVILFVHYTYMPRVVLHKWLSKKWKRGLHKKI